MSDIESLQRLIDHAKEDNDEVLIAYLNQAINHLVQKQIQQETQQVNAPQEEKQESTIQENNTNNNERHTIKEEDIKKVRTGEVSRLITTKTDNHIVESKYMDIPSNAENSSLRTELNSVLLTLALDDITKQENATKELFEIIAKYDSPKDIDDIMAFLDSIEKIGQTGAKAKSRIRDNEQEEVYTNYFNDQFDTLEKNANFLDMELDEMKGKPTINDKQVEELIDSYQALIQKLETLQDETFKKVAPEKEQKLDKLIQSLKETKKSIEKLINGLKEITESADKAFNSI